MGNAGPSFVYNILENDEDTDKENRDSLKYAAATFYGAGSDTVRQLRVLFDFFN